MPYYQELWSASSHNQTVPCQTCHNESTTAPSSFTLASGFDIIGQGSEVPCLECHQSQWTTLSVDEVLAGSDLGEDTPSDRLVFIGNQNYAAGTNMGTWAMAGYQYPGKAYEARYAHVDEYDACADCHDPHTLEIKIDGCGECHQGVNSLDDLERIRGEISKIDYDGDGKIQEGIVREIEGLQEHLYQAIQSYAEQNRYTILYDPNTPPFYFFDANENGELDDSEVTESNHYNAWTARLLKAAYNYHFSMADPGAFIHNGKYILQLLYDSIEDLDGTLVENLTRNDRGHFDGSSAAWRHWDEPGEVPRDCARCHSATGLPTYLSVELDYAQPVSNGMACATCHTNLQRFQRHTVHAVKFPSKVTLSIDSDSNLCLNCHQGNSSSANLEARLEDLDPDAVSEGLSLPDAHHYPAGATLFGSEAGGAYQYSGKKYAGRNPHVFEFSTCVNCHSGHGMAVDEEQCATCHGRRASDERTKPIHHPSPMACRDCHGMVDVRNIRGHKDYTIPVDHDGDGDLLEGLSGEVVTLEEALYAAIQAYTSKVIGTQIVFDPHIPPYYFKDSNGNGIADHDETHPDNGYSDWTPRLLRAAYNYHYSVMEPGSYAHNGVYIIQVLIDSLKDIGADTSGMIRP